MKYVFILSLFFCSNLWALDSFSVVRSLGTEGRSGSQVLQLICAQNKCQITSTYKDKVSERKNISQTQADEIFKAAKLALVKPIKVKNALKSYVLEIGKQKIETQSSTPELLTIEYKLQQLLIP